MLDREAKACFQARAGGGAGGGGGAGSPHFLKWTMLMIYEINHIWTAEVKCSENEEMIVAVNAIYAIA